MDLSQDCTWKSQAKTFHFVRINVCVGSFLLTSESDNLSLFVVLSCKNFSPPTHLYQSESDCLIARRTDSIRLIQSVWSMNPLVVVEKRGSGALLIRTTIDLLNSIQLELDLTDFCLHFQFLCVYFFEIELILQFCSFLSLGRATGRCVCWTI